MKRIIDILLRPNLSLKLVELLFKKKTNIIYCINYNYMIEIRN